MQSLFFSAEASEHADRLADIMREEGFVVDVRVVGPSLASNAVGGATEYKIVFVDSAIGVTAAKELCRDFTASIQYPRPLIALVGGMTTDAEVDALMGAGVNVHLGGDDDAFGSRLRFLKNAVRTRGMMIADLRGECRAGHPRGTSERAHDHHFDPA